MDFSSFRNSNEYTKKPDKTQFLAMREFTVLETKKEAVHTFYEQPL